MLLSTYDLTLLWGVHYWKKKDLQHTARGDSELIHFSTVWRHAGQVNCMSKSFIVMSVSDCLFNYKYLCSLHGGLGTRMFLHPLLHLHCTCRRLQPCSPPMALKRRHRWIFNGCVLNSNCRSAEVEDQWQLPQIGRISLFRTYPLEQSIFMMKYHTRNCLKWVKLTYCILTMSKF